MTTFVPFSTPARQPFGMLSETKLRNLQSMKNKQNAITPNSAPSLKRRAPSPELSDSENVDPNILDTCGKRKRAAFDDDDEDVSLSKPSRYRIQILPAVSKTRDYTPTATTPRLDTRPKQSSNPASAPAAAGRSPTRGKRLGLLRSSKRFAPPAFGSKSPSLSITAALQGTLAHKKAKRARTIEESNPKSWFFDIFEESNEQQDYRMNEWTMTQSATILDISDDEGKAQEESDRGKENVDPNAASVPTTRSMAAAATVPAKPSRKDMMHDEPRSPLGNLDPTEFYAEGLDATSVVLVHDDAQEDMSVNADVTATSTTSASVLDEQVVEKPAQELPVAVQAEHGFTFETEDKLSHSLPTSIDTIISGDIGLLIAASEPIWTDAVVPIAACSEPESMECSQSDTSFGVPSADNSESIDIWESASAKDENEQVESLKLVEDDGVFALQEL